MSFPNDQSLYDQVVAEAKLKVRYPSLYASVWIHKEYVSRGGKFEDTEAKRWCQEKWVHVIPFIKSGRVVDCHKGAAKACRPIWRVDKDTPVTLPELLNMYTKTQILDMARKKNKNMKKDVDWENLEFN